VEAELPLLVPVDDDEVGKTYVGVAPHCTWKELFTTALQVGNVAGVLMVQLLSLYRVTVATFMAQVTLVELPMALKPKVLKRTVEFKHMLTFCVSRTA
jgi:hypothetical protein